MSWFNLFRNSWAVGILCTQKKGWRKKIGLSEKWFSGGKGLIRWHREAWPDMHSEEHNMLKLWNRNTGNQLTQLKTGNYSCSWTKLGIKSSQDSWFLLQYRYFTINSVKNENLSRCWWFLSVGDIVLAHFGPLTANWASFLASAVDNHVHSCLSFHDYTVLGYFNRKMCHITKLMSSV